MITGKVALKMRYLGGAHVGQELCWYRIDITENAVTVIVCKGQDSRVVRFFDGEQETESIKAKLRVFLARMRSSGRIVFDRPRKGLARIVSYYPSRRWETGRGRVSWMGDGSI